VAGRIVNRPPVSVFLAVRNEEHHLADCVASILGQDYAGEIEVVLAVAPSGDRTLEVAGSIAAEHGSVTVLENPAALTPHGLNLAIKAARHDILVRADGHSVLPPDYVSRVVLLLEQTGAANVGGRMEPLGDAPVAAAVARAMSSRFGIGGGAFHVGGEAGPQPTVYLGAFRRQALEDVQGYDEFFARAQDWDLNHRLRARGHAVWFDPSIAVGYRPRASWREFAEQQFRTGGWRRRMIERYPQTASLRYLAPPVAVLAIVAGTLAGLSAVLPGPIPGWLALGFCVPLAYLLGITAVGLIDGRGLAWRVRVRLPLAIGLLHVSWGAGFLLRAP
jgi:glycosyltransferase involved in cell wall biosynthesis